MNIEISTPALLFSTVSLLILAFNNRFISIASLIRDLINKYKINEDDFLYQQISQLKFRATVIKIMQIVAVSSLLLSVITMFLLFYTQQDIAKISFSLALILLAIAMLLSIYELILSTNALDISISEIKKKEKVLN